MFVISDFWIWLCMTITYNVRKMKRKPKMINVKIKIKFFIGFCKRFKSTILHEDIINHLIHNLEQDVSRLKNELFRRENNLVDHQTGEDMFEFGLPIVDRKDEN